MDASRRSRRRLVGAPTPSVFFVALALILLALVGCSQPGPSIVSIPPDATGSALPAITASPQPSDPASPAPSAAAVPVEVTGSDGVAVTLPEAPSRIVSLTPAATETLFAIGAGDRVVAKVEDIANHPPQAADLPVVGTFAGVDVERIVALEANLVIAGGNGGTPQDSIDRLRDLGVPVLVVYAEDVDGVFADIELIGRAAGAVDAARAIAEEMEAGFDAVAEATANLDRPRVFYETGDQPAIYGVADESFVAAMLELAGGEPITTGSPTVWEMSRERLVAADPEVILLGDAAYGVTPEAVAARPGWSGLTAVRDGEIHPIDDIVVTRPGPRLLDGLHALVRAIHPEVELPEPSAGASAAPSPAASGG